MCAQQMVDKMSAFPDSFKKGTENKNQALDFYKYMVVILCTFT